MVNIAGRSRGCSTCRLRRVKCDESQPICRRCERCGFQCSGVKGITFIDQTRIQQAGTGISLPSVIHPTTHPKAQKDTISASPNLKGFEFQTYICYTRKHLLRGGSVDLALEDLQLSDIHIAGESSDDAKMLHRAILSLAVIFFGNQHRKPSISHQGYVIHGMVLKELNQALEDPKCYMRDEVVLSVMTLILLEIFIPTGRGYYLEHLAGLEKLLELRGPNTNHSPRSFQIDKGIRRMILVASLSRRKPSILARKEWRGIPWTNEEAMEEQRLLDVLVDYTVVLAEFDEMAAMWQVDAKDASRQRYKVTRRSMDLLEELHAWKKKWDIDHNFEITTMDAGLLLTSEDCGKDAIPLPTFYSFSNDSTATMVMLYNTSLIVVLRILASLPLKYPCISAREYSKHSQIDDSLHLKSNRWSANGEYRNAERLAALEIYRCVPYFESREAFLDTNSLTVGHLAVKTAWLTLGGSNSIQGRRLMNILRITDREICAKGLWVD